MEKDLALKYAASVLEKREREDIPSSFESLARRMRVNRFLKAAHARNGEVIALKGSESEELKKFFIAAGAGVTILFALAKVTDIALEMMRREAQASQNNPLF